MIPTLGRRKLKLESLLGDLLPQVDQAGGEVVVEALWNNGERPIGQVRQDMMEHATGDYVSFVDDDDGVPAYFVRRVLPLLDGTVDYIGWRQRLWRGNQEMQRVIHSLRYPGWIDEEHGFYRDLTHFNPMRRDLASSASFRGNSEAWSEDYDWARRLRGKVVTEHYIDAVMYLQRFDYMDNTGPVRRPADNPSDYTRLEVSSPYFSWHPLSGGT